LAAGFAALAVALLVLQRRRRTDQLSERFDPADAWLRAFVYFAAIWAVAAASGTLTTILRSPLVFPGQLDDWRWRLATAGLAAMIFVGYWVIWPLGTRSHGRSVVLPDTIVFGLAWGISEGLLFASVWVVGRRLLGTGGAPDVALTLGAIVVISAFIGTWHARYWDIHVAPEHNVASWNLPKVLLVHTPNVVTTTAYVTATGNLAIWVLLQAFALIGSALFMRFPTFRSPYEKDPIG